MSDLVCEAKFMTESRFESYQAEMPVAKRKLVRKYIGI